MTLRSWKLIFVLTIGITYFNHLSLFTLSKMLYKYSFELSLCNIPDSNITNIIQKTAYICK